MDLEIRGEVVRKLALVGPISRKIYLYKDKRKSAGLYIQRSDLFSINLFSAIQMLEKKEIDEIRYSPSNNELISIFITQEGELTATYFTNDSNKEKELSIKLGIKQTNNSS